MNETHGQRLEDEVATRLAKHEASQREAFGNRQRLHGYLAHNTLEIAARYGLGERREDVLLDVLCACDGEDIVVSQAYVEAAMKIAGFAVATRRPLDL